FEPAGGFIAFGTNAGGAVGSERMRIDSAGNVGIGLVSPGARLEVMGPGNTGSVRITGPFIDPIIGSNSTGYQLNLVGGNPDAAMPNAVNTMGGQVRLGGSTRGDGDVNVVQFLQNGTERMRIHNGGSVGIGTPAPSHLLHVFSNTNLQLPMIRIQA